jgi:hypothetical protein
MNGPYYATPSWDQQLPAAQRFIVLSNWNNAAVLDRETGLIWEEAPNQISSMTWAEARDFCVNKTVGNRKGWRLPHVDELLSLYNTMGSGPNGGLPGSPFVTPTTVFYWSSTVVLNDSGVPVENVSPLGQSYSLAYIVGFTLGGLTDGAFMQPTLGGLSAGAWCVRGGSAGNAQ